MKDGRNTAAAVALLGVVLMSLAASPSSTQSVRPATTRAATAPATTQALATVDPAAEPLLAQLQKAYSTAGPFQVVGDIVGEFDVAGRKKRYTLHVAGRTDGDGRFRHDVGSTGLIVNDGASAFLYDAKRDAYATLPAFIGRQAADEIEQSLIDVLLDENPALLLSLTTDPKALLRRSVTAIRPATQPTSLVLEQPEKTITLQFRPADGVIVRSDVDFLPLMKNRKAEGVVAAHATLIYQQPTPGPQPDAVFTWHPPATATEFEIESEKMQSGPTTQPSTRPVGRR